MSKFHIPHRVYSCRIFSRLDHFIRFGSHETLLQEYQHIGLQTKTLGLRCLGAVKKYFFQLHVVNLGSFRTANRHIADVTLTL